MVDISELKLFIIISEHNGRHQNFSLAVSPAQPVAILHY